MVPPMPYATNDSAADAVLNSMLWKPAAVQCRAALVTPFFTTRPTPCILGTGQLPFFFSALAELSQLVDEVARHAPIRGHRGNVVLFNYLVFHLTYFVDVALKDGNFLAILEETNKGDTEAKEYVDFLQCSGLQFANKWHEVTNLDYESGDITYSRDTLVMAKDIADEISLRTTSMTNLPDRVFANLSWLAKLDNFLIEGFIPNWVILLWFVWGVVVALVIDIMIWIMRSSPTLWNAVTITVTCTTGLMGFLVFFYSFSRRKLVASMLSERLSANLSQDYYRLLFNGGHRGDKEDEVVQLNIRPKSSNTVRALTLKPVIINRQLVMIGIADLDSLKVCSWNLGARLATGITWEQAIGKSLEVLMDPHCIDSVRTLFQELNQNPRQQKRLLFNSIAENSVAIRASATVSFIDGIPVAMLVGTILEEEERAMMSYISRIGLFTLTSKLLEKKVEDPFLHDIVLGNSWDALKEKTSQAIRNWSSCNLDGLVDTIDSHGLSLSVRVYCDASVPDEFQCDAKFLPQLILKMLKFLNNAMPEAVINVQLSKTLNSPDCEALVIILEVVSSKTDAAVDTVLHELWGFINSVGYLFNASRGHVEIHIPIVSSREDTKLVPASMGGSVTNAQVYTFVVYEPDPVYATHVGKFCGAEQHRYFPVGSPDFLESLLDSLSNELSAAILSSSGEWFDHMSSICKQRNIYVVSTKTGFGKSMEFFARSFDGPPREMDGNVNYVLHIPIQLGSWHDFLESLQEERKRQRTISAPPTQEYEKLCDLGISVNSRVEKVRDTLTGGIVARKMVRLSPGREYPSLLAEVEIMKHIGIHPNIVRYIGSHCPTPDEFCMLFQYCDGGTIADYLRTLPGERITASQLPPFAQQILTAVQHIHSCGVAHRDIKPDNILRSDSATLKLADFGSATRSDLTAGTMIGGTLAFMAPERLMDVVASGEGMTRLFAEDMWSVGLTLLVALGGYPAALQSAVNMQDYLRVYVGLRERGRELEFSIPFDSQSPTLTSLATDFIRSMLRMAPASRKSASELLCHPYLHRCSSMGDCSLSYFSPVQQSPKNCSINYSTALQQFNDVLVSSSEFTADGSEEDPV